MSDNDKKTFYCAGCGGVMQYDISAGELKCPYCGLKAEIPDDGRVIREHDFNLEADQGETTQWNQEAHVLKCDNCGAEVVVEKNVTSVTCAYCGSSHVLESKQMAGIKPEAILPFKVDKGQASQIFHTWVKKRWFAPNALKNLYQQDKMNAIYTPYWTYDADASASYTGEGGEVYYVTVKDSEGNTHRERRVRWYFVSGHVGRFFDDVLVSAKSDDKKWIEKVGYYNTGELKPFSSIYLSGFQAEKYEISPKQGFVTAQNIMYRQLESDARQQILMRYDEARNIRLRASYSNVKFKHTLMPVWTSGYMYKDKLYNFVINGQNGKISGNRPYSPVKITIASIIALILIILALVLFMKYDEADDYYGGAENYLGGYAEVYNFPDNQIIIQDDNEFYEDNRDIILTNRIVYNGGIHDNEVFSKKI